MPNKKRSSYSIYNEKADKKIKKNLLDDLYPPLPKKKYSIIYLDPPWHYNGKMQFDKSGLSANNKDWNKDIFISAANFKYPTLKTPELKMLDIPSIAEDDSLIFMWTTNPHLAQAIDLGESWGFDYKTVAFVWNKMVHNPGQYTMSYCELCLLFKRGKIPQPRGARNIKQLVNSKRTKHSQKPIIVSDHIEMMFPSQKKIELFSRARKTGWDSWGLESIYERKTITSKEDLLIDHQNDLLDS